VAIKDTTIWVKPTTGIWESLGSETGRGIWAEDVQLAADERGSSSAQFTLRRDGRRRWPDIAKFTEIKVEVSGILVWSGRVKETPSKDGADMAISVSCEGWQFHLDDDLYRPFYVHNNLGDWKDLRSYLACPVGVPNGLSSVFSISAGDGGIAISVAKDSLWPVNGIGGVVLDLGPGLVAEAAAIDISGTSAQGNFYLRGFNSLASLTTPNDIIAGPVTAGGPFHNDGVFATPSRYIAAFMYNSGPDYTVATVDAGVKISGLRVFASSAYQSGGASVLDAADVIGDALTRAPLLSSDRSQIDPDGLIAFHIPSMAPGALLSPRQAIGKANDYHNWQFKIDERRVPIFHPRPTTATIKLGTRAGYVSEDAAGDATDNIYDRAWVSWTAPDGTPCEVIRTITPSPTPGFHRTHELQVQATLPADGVAAANLGDAWLSDKARAAFKGTGTVTGPAEDILTGQGVPPERLLLATGEMLRFDDRIDPITGTTFRDARMTQVTYTPAADTAVVTLDNTRSDFDALMARIDVATGASRGS
jgi:hypothetical protein